MADLLLLQRGLMEARFARDADDPVLMGSPRLGAMHAEIVQIIIERYEQAGDRFGADSWREWRRWEDRVSQREVIRSRWISDGLPNRDRAIQLAWLQACIQPFEASTDEVVQFLEDLRDSGPS